MRGKSCAVAILLAASAMPAQPAAAQTPTVDQLPAALKPAGMAVYLEVPATGVQIYTCGKNNAGAWAWNFKGPEAELFDTQKKSIGKHYGGPTWEGADGGKVVGAMKANAPAPGGSSIPWLLLTTKGAAGLNGDRLAGTTFIQRVNTTGGVSPGGFLITASAVARGAPRDRALSPG